VTCGGQNLRRALFLNSTIYQFISICFPFRKKANPKILMSKSDMINYSNNLVYKHRFWFRHSLFFFIYLDLGRTRQDYGLFCKGLLKKETEYVNSIYRPNHVNGCKKGLFPTRPSSISLKIGIVRDFSKKQRS
jgi:hypothetical protein